MAKEYVELYEGIAYRIAGTRVSLDSVVYEYKKGHSPESIQDSFPALTLEQVYGAIAYYLGNKEKIDQYLAEGEIEWEKFRKASYEKHREFYERMDKARKQMLTSQP
ncbi:MAG TPA: DUF433 domain-containing protein [Pyrinomonadaceae bacterium]|nr:DUF433 domain-containing protein [Pyrinomonadaceae bacterium]